MGLMTKIMARLEGVPAEWYDTGRLAGWEAAHANPAGDVWGICGFGDQWHLYPPGSPNGTNFPYADVDPAATMPACDGRTPSDPLEAYRAWSWPWVERASGRPVMDSVEGWSWYGPDGTMREYQIYVRTGGVDLCAQ